MCEIEGVGPVPVSTATDLLGHGALRYVVNEGFDIKAVTRPTRDIAACVDAALLVRDRTCVVAHCGNRHGLEGDHVRIDCADDGPTELDNVTRPVPAVGDTLIRNVGRTVWGTFRLQIRRAGLKSVLPY
jgi:hypothetical protein